jgi:O-antigen/teichoic acid export membrane protein
MQIGRKDIFWNYAATFLKIASSALLLPFILKMMPSETIGIWSVFVTITAFAGLLDFGFNPSFARNVTYIFSGVSSLRVEGFQSGSHENQSIDYGLLKGLIAAMRWFYLRMAIILFLLLSTLGTYYIFSLLQNYKGDTKEVYVAWVLLCAINTYNLYTLYYDALLQGKGLVKRSKQIVIAGQTVYLVIAAVLIMIGYGLVAIVSAQASSVIIIRWLSYHSFYTREIKDKFNKIVPRSRKEVLAAISPNAIKIGLTMLGSFMVQRSAIIIGSLFLPLEEIASYGVTMQLIAIITGFATIYTSTYQPKIAQLRVKQDNHAIKEVYLKGQIIMLLTYLAGGIALLGLGEWALNLINSKTQLIPTLLLLIAVFISLLESNHSIAGGILLTKNEVPFFKAALLSGALTILLLQLFFHFTNLGLMAMILAPGLAQGVYQNWKWPLVVHNELGITCKDFYNAFSNFFNHKSIVQVKINSHNN